MKQSKRIFLSLLVVVLLTFCTLTAFAVTEEVPALKVAVSVTSDTAIKGVDQTFGVQKDDVLDFTVVADANDLSVFTADLVVEFDTAYVDLVADSVQISESYGAANSQVYVEDGKITVAFLSYKAGNKLEGKLLSFSLKVKDVHGDTTVTVTMPTIANSATKDIAVDWTGNNAKIGVHNYGEARTVDEIPNDCTAGAKTFRACTVEDCNAQIIIARPNEASHDNSGSAATCTTNQVCARQGCEVVIQEALGHDTTGPDATCTAEKVCARGCGEVLEPKKEHQFGEWTVVKEPTMSDTGLEERSCVCGLTETRDIPEKSSTWLVVLIIVLVVVLAGGGFAAYWFLIRGKKATAESDEITEETSDQSNEEATDEKTEE